MIHYNHNNYNLVIGANGLIKKTKTKNAGFYNAHEKVKCVDRESNPGHLLGRQVF